MSYRPEVFTELPTIEDLSGRPSVIVTNALLAAGLLFIVLFSSVLFNQTLQEHRGQLEGWLSKLATPFRRAGAALNPPGSLPRPVWQAICWALVLGVTGLVYTLLEPSPGWDRQSAVLFVSVVIGTGLLTYLYSGLEVMMTEHHFRLDSAVRLYLPCVVVALIAVGVSRLIGVHPGVVYGFVASAVVLEAGEIPEEQAGKINIVPVTACLSVSIVCWLLTPWVRDQNPDGSSFTWSVIEGVFVMSFVGGIEGLLWNMIPLRVMDGGKVYRWKKALWAVLTGAAAFLFWYVLLNHDRSSYDSLYDTASLFVVLVCVAYALAAVGTWGYFRVRYE